MTSRRLISCCLGVLAAVLLLAGCGSEDSTSADIDPVITEELTAQLDKIQTFFEDGNCDRARGAVDGLRDAVDARAEETGEQFTADMTEIVDNLEGQVDDQCEESEPTTIDETTTDPIDTEPTTTDTEPTTTSTTTKETTTTETTPTTPTPPNGNGNGNGPPTPPGGGISPGEKKQKQDGGKQQRDDKERPRR